MPESIVTKRCPRCKAVKPVAEFSKNRASRDGLLARCKSCDRAKGALYEKSNKGRAARRRYSATPAGRVADTKTKRSYRQRHPIRERARQCVTYAIKTGRIPPAKRLICRHCFALADGYHHHRGYAEENQLDVIPLCRRCHLKAG